MTLKNQIKELFYKRAPNSLRLEHIIFEFPNEQVEKLQQLLNKLVEEKFLYKEPEVPAEADIPQCDIYRINPDYKGKVPIETEILIGALKIPRKFDGTSKVIAEDINTVFLVFNRIISETKKELKSNYDRELKKYWGTMITIFGIFLAIFSMVNISMKPFFISTAMKLDIDQLDICDILLQSLFNILPLTLILIVFFLALVWLLKSK